MPVPSERADTARTLLRDQAYARLRDAILDGTLEPGEQLKDAELAEWLGLSRTPIREAVARLEEYGLVETKPNSYTRVAPLSARDARDAFPVVAALETGLGLKTVMVGFASPNGNFHAPNEWMPLANYRGGMKALVRLWDELGGASPAELRGW